MTKDKITVSNVKITNKMNDIFMKGKKVLLTTLVSAGLITGLTGCGESKQERIKDAETLEIQKEKEGTLEIKEDIFAKEADKEALKDPNKDEDTIYVEAPPIIAPNEVKEGVQDFTPDADGWVTLDYGMTNGEFPEEFQKKLDELGFEREYTTIAFLPGDRINLNTMEIELLEPSSKDGLTRKYVINNKNITAIDACNAISGLKASPYLIGNYEFYLDWVPATKQDLFITQEELDVFFNEVDNTCHDYVVNADPYYKYKGSK